MVILSVTLYYCGIAFKIPLYNILESETLAVRNTKSCIRRFDWLPRNSIPVFKLVNRTREPTLTKATNQNAGFEILE